MGGRFLNRFRLPYPNHSGLQPKESAPCACSEPWVRFRENFTKQKGFRSIPTSLWPPPAKKSAPCACSEPWVRFRENFTKQKR
ncbi:hypothetical protein TNCV_4451281, partial [Trichonephila clavipes]